MVPANFHYSDRRDRNKNMILTNSFIPSTVSTNFAIFMDSPVCKIPHRGQVDSVRRNRLRPYINWHAKGQHIRRSHFFVLREWWFHAASAVIHISSLKSKAKFITTRHGSYATSKWISKFLEMTSSFHYLALPYEFCLWQVSAQFCINSRASFYYSWRISNMDK